MATISWKEALPSGTSKVGLGPKDITHHWKMIQAGLDTSMYWSGTSSGILKQGAARTFHDVASNATMTSAVTNHSRLYWASDTSVLYLLGYASVGDTARSYAGSGKFPEHYTDPFPGSWRFQADEVLVSAASIGVTQNQNFGMTLNGIPQVFASSHRSEYVVTVTNINTSGFSYVVARLVNEANSATSVRWCSLATRSGSL